MICHDADSADAPSFAVFHSAADCQWVTALRESYERAFAGRLTLAGECRRVPELLAMEEVTQKKPWPLSGVNTVGYLPRALSVEEKQGLSLRAFLTSTPTVLSLTAPLTRVLLERSVAYLTERQRYLSAYDPQILQTSGKLRRKVTPSYPDGKRNTASAEAIDTAVDVYLVILLCEQLQSLTEPPASHALRGEYETLGRWISTILPLAQHYLPHSEHPLHGWLSTVLGTVSQIQRTLTFYLVRQGLLSLLDQVTDALCTYQKRLIIYLMYSLSDCPLGHLCFSWELFQDDDTVLPLSFKPSRLYQQLRRVLNQQPIASRLSVSDPYLWSPLQRLAKRSAERRQSVEAALSAADDLLQLLGFFNDLTIQLESLGQSTRLYEDDTPVQDTRLNKLLRVHLAWVLETMQATEERIERLNQITLAALAADIQRQAPAVEPELPSNLRQAQLQTGALKKIPESIKRYQTQLESRLEAIQSVHYRVVTGQHAVLWEKTQQCLHQQQKTGIIEGRSLKVLDSVVSHSRLVNSGGCMLTDHSLDPPHEPVSASASNTEPLPLSERFSDIYALFQTPEHRHWQIVFETLMQSFDREIEHTLPALLDQLERIEQLTAELDQAIAADNATDSATLAIFYQLQQLISQTSYLNQPFSNCDFVKQLVAQWVLPKIKEEMNIIEPLLQIANGDWDSSNYRGVLPANKRRLSILTHVFQKIEPIKNRVDALQKKLTDRDFRMQVAVVDYYHTLIAEAAEALPPEEQQWVQARLSGEASPVDDQPTVIPTATVIEPPLPLREAQPDSPADIAQSAVVVEEPTPLNASSPTASDPVATATVATLPPTTDRWASPMTESVVGEAQSPPPIPTITQPPQSAQTEQPAVASDRVSSVDTRTTAPLPQRPIATSAAPTQSPAPPHRDPAPPVYPRETATGHGSDAANTPDEPASLEVSVAVVELQNGLWYGGSTTRQLPPRPNYVSNALLQETCEALFRDDITAVHLEQKLGVLFFSILLERPYRLRGWGGSVVRGLFGDVKVPHHIQVVFDRYVHEMVTIRQIARRGDRLEPLKALRDSIFKTIGQAAECPPVVCCGLFRLRDKHTTQAVYETMARHAR